MDFTTLCADRKGVEYGAWEMSKKSGVTDGHSLVEWNPSLFRWFDSRLMGEESRPSLCEVAVKEGGRCSLGICIDLDEDWSDRSHFATLSIRLRTPECCGAYHSILFLTGVARHCLFQPKLLLVDSNLTPVVGLPTMLQLRCEP